VLVKLIICSEVCEQVSFLKAPVKKVAGTCIAKKEILLMSDRVERERD